MENPKSNLKKRIINLFFLLLINTTILIEICAYASPSYPTQYIIEKFWDEEHFYYFSKQSTNFTCISASIQMILNVTGLSNMTSQNELAKEMHSDENHTVQWKYTYIPFLIRNYTIVYNNTLSDNPDKALHILKQYLYNNSLIIVKTWFSEYDKNLQTMTHARVVIGYNETGIFYHDSLVGPKIFSYNSEFIDLWDVNNEFWAIIVQSKFTEEKEFNIIEWINNNLDILGLLIIGLIVEVHYVSRISNFTNSIALYLFYTRNRIHNPLLQIYVIIGIFLGLIGIVSYMMDESLPSEYYAFCMVFYNSATIALIMLLFNTILK